MIATITDLSQRYLRTGHQVEGLDFARQSVHEDFCFVVACGIFSGFVPSQLREITESRFSAGPDGIFEFMVSFESLTGGNVSELLSVD